MEQARLDGAQGLEHGAEVLQNIGPAGADQETVKMVLRVHIGIQGPVGPAGAEGQDGLKLQESHRV